MSLKVKNDIASELTINHTAGASAKTLESIEMVKVVGGALKDLDDINIQTGLGAGQTWQDMISNRSSGVTYTNTTGRPIYISFSNTSGGTVNVLTIDGLSVAVTNGASGVYGTAGAVVPNNSTYLVGGTIVNWVELR